MLISFCQTVNRNIYCFCQLHSDNDKKKISTNKDLQFDGKLNERMTNKLVLLNTYIPT